MPVAQNSLVHHGNADPHRAFARRAGDRHQPAHARCDRSLDACDRAVLAETGDAAVDEARTDAAQALVVDTEPIDVGMEVAVTILAFVGCTNGNALPGAISFGITLASRVMISSSWREGRVLSGWL
jgi:hypothetical protein